MMYVIAFILIMVCLSDLNTKLKSIESKIDEMKDNKCHKETHKDKP